MAFRRGGLVAAICVVLLVVMFPLPASAAEPHIPMKSRIRGWYLGFVHREPDTSGMNYWSSQVQAECDDTYETALRSFAQLNEVIWVMSANLNPIQRVDRAYQIIVNRAPDIDGHEFWAAALFVDGVAGWKNMVRSLIASSEFATKSRNICVNSCSTTLVDPDPVLRYETTRAAMSQEAGVTFPLSRRSEMQTQVFDAYIRDRDQQIWFNPFVGRVWAKGNSGRNPGLGFDPGDSKGRVVLDFQRGQGWAVINSTTWEFDPQVGPSVNVTVSALDAAFSWKSSAANWVWQDWIAYPTTSRVRFSFTIAPPGTQAVPPAFDQGIDFVLPSIDKQYVVVGNTPTVEGDSWPTHGAYVMQRCSPESFNVFWELQSPDTSTGGASALAESHDYSHDSPLGRHLGGTL